VRLLGIRRHGERGDLRDGAPVDPQWPDMPTRADSAVAAQVRRPMALAPPPELRFLVRH
jgi:hypothetical protein